MKINIKKLSLLNILRKNYLIISAFLLFTILIVIYINKTYIDVLFLDGLNTVPILGKLFEGNLSFADINRQLGEHRLLGYKLIFILNSLIFHLNIKIEPFIFLFSYFSIALIFYFVYTNFLRVVLKADFRPWMNNTYLPILFLIFSLVHPPLMFMTTEFVIGTLFFVLFTVFFDKICLDSNKWLDLFWFLVLILIYFIFFSGANFGGVLLGFFISCLIKIIFSRKKQLNLSLMISIISTLLMTISYIKSVDVSKGASLTGKTIIFVSKFKESFAAIISGISATTLDIHTFQELLKGNNTIILINGSVLILFGIYSVFKYIYLRMYKFTYIPILLIFYSVGHIVSTKLGRLKGDWLWPMNEWYSFHLYFYLIGILWILFFDILKKYIRLSKKSPLFLYKKHLWTVVFFVFSIIWIFSFQFVSNAYLWYRAQYVYQFYEEKRQAILFPTDESLKTLLCTKEESLNAIKILKKYRLSTFRQSKNIFFPGNIIKSSNWNPDGWISKEAKAVITSGEKGMLSFLIFVPPNILANIYNDSITATFLLNSKDIKTMIFKKSTFENGAITLHLKVPINEVFVFEVKTDKSYIPLKYGLGRDERELSIIIDRLNVK